MYYLKVKVAMKPDGNRTKLYTEMNVGRLKTEHLEQTLKLLTQRYLLTVFKACLWLTSKQQRAS